MSKRPLVTDCGGARAGVVDVQRRYEAERAGCYAIGCVEASDYDLANLLARVAGEVPVG